MSTPPWGHKPAPVDDQYAYWTEPPSALSPRVEYWLRRLADGTWVPNKYFNRECNQCRASWLGVYVWEYDHVIGPALAGREAELVSA